ncbi:MAG TPA: IucA/IucC family protein [Actinoplanes sp.]|nr:IucA/IucC family protein [Actinoplanes sp.]
MTRTLTTGRLAVAAAHTGAALAVHAPELADPFFAALPEAAELVGRRLRGALVREDIGDAQARHAGRGTRYAFDRVEFDTAGAEDPVDLLAGMDAPEFAAELRNAVVNLAVAMARSSTTPAPAWPPPGAVRAARATADPDLAAVALERLAVAGHNLHPCGRTRLGWDTTDVLAHDLESGHTAIGFVAVRDDGHLGDDLGDALATAYPQLPEPPPGYRLQPVHAWQRDSVLPARYGDLIRDGALRPLDAELDAVPTAALRTLLLPPGADGLRRYLKVSLDIQVTSTRRSVSVASTRNGPAVSAVLRRLAGDDPDGHRIVLLAETAGAAVPAGSGRDLSAILRDAMTGRLHAATALPGHPPGEVPAGPMAGPMAAGQVPAGWMAGEVAVPGSALPAVDPATGRTVLAGLVDASGAGAIGWLRAYARLLLPPLLRFTARGVALEAHLQNCLPTFTRGMPQRLVIRDFAGLRLHLPRLAAGGLAISLWPGSVIGTGDDDVLLAKIGYTAFQAHLGELIIRLGESHGLAEDAAWRVVREVVDQAYDGLDGDSARRDHAALTAARMPHKALVRMRLTGGGDTYLPVRNPLHARA